MRAVKRVLLVSFVGGSVGWLLAQALAIAMYP